ncbi:MAG: FAD-dependent oxidoreductase [Planctomycetes bacterium]|nr:FAD-dependent oxidoreductase [Planctomycetota bacterium]
MSDSTNDPLLADVDGLEALLLGNEAIVRGALEAGVAFAAGYPGTPSSEVTDSFARVAGRLGLVFEYSVNEKIALEMAFAASLAGARSICAMKHLGLMYAGDPISTIPYVGVKAGMVIVSAGDPSCATSPNEQDQRHLGAMLHVPILDPSTPREAHSMARLAFDLSEKSRLPVILRATTRVCHSRAAIRCGRLGERTVAGFVRDPKRYTPIPVNARAMRLEIPGRLEAARAFMSEAGLFQRTGAGRRAVLATGAPAAVCRDILREEGLQDSVVLAVMGGVHPLPAPELCALLAEVETLLVVEELSPFVEDALCALCHEHGLRTRILGKRSGHLPVEFEYSPAIIRRGLCAALGLEVRAPVAAKALDPVVPRPPNLCAGCPHRSTYFAARAAFGKEHLYFNDIGCYTLGYGAPLDTVDGLLCMGAGFTLAAGVARVTGTRTVGFVGDSTFFHSGMAPLLNAIKEDVNMVAVILDNQVTGMTGFQESPTVSIAQGAPARKVSIEGVARALGARHVETVRPSDLAATILAFERARAASGVSVIIAEEPCPMFLGRLKGGERSRPAVYTVDHERCQTCGREGSGQRCQQPRTLGQERSMARSRALCASPEGASCDGGARPARVAPCALACPLGLCVQGYAAHIFAGQYCSAFELIASRCPLPHSVCRVCHRPCETTCVHAASGEPVAINDLKRFVADWAAREGVEERAPPRPKPNGKSAAVVGAGPAGLAAAHDLALRGYEVTLYDAADAPGGLLRSGIPLFRLPVEALERDVARILALGVRFEGGRRLGLDLNLDDLLARHDAVLVALGAHHALGLGVAGGEAEAGGAPRVVDALAYLEEARAGLVPRTGERVAVVGGGNAAIDAARTALRLGARQVTIVYRRRREEMPALKDEIAEALLEGVELCTQLDPVRLVQAAAGAPCGLECARTEPGEPDASGRRRPLRVVGSEILVEVDQVITAVGQAPETETLRVAGELLARKKDGSVEVDPETGQTSHARVFAAGDVTPGERTVTSAIAAGQRAAWGLDVGLRGRAAADLRPPPQLAAAARGAEQPHLARVDRAARRRPPELSVERRGGFDENVGALSESQARAEAGRCAVCGMCGNCRSCLDLFGCPAFYLEEGRIEIDPLLCSGCGVCAEFCPNNAIVPRSEP